MIFDEFSFKSLIRPVVDFPKPGVIFRDITPLFQSPKALRLVMDSFVQRYIDSDFTHVGAMDARGFLIGSIIAYELNKPLVLFRKQGKLPGEVVRHEYALEYGTDVIEIQADAIDAGDRVVVLDDLLATGGTMSATVDLLRRQGAEVPGVACIIELTFLGGRKRLDCPVETLIAYDD